jgi:hypothetical protein
MPEWRLPGDECPRWHRSPEVRVPPTARAHLYCVRRDPGTQVSWGGLEALRLENRAGRETRRCWRLQHFGRKRPSLPTGSEPHPPPAVLESRASCQNLTSRARSAPCRPGRGHRSPIRLVPVAHSPTSTARHRHILPFNKY